jgi:branched-chain amino acid aminotransferase
VLWLNGRLLRPDEARIDPADRGLLLADGLFETLRADQGVPADLDAHLDRLEAGALVLGIEPPASRAEVRQACADVLAAALLAEGPAGLRITLTRGPAPRGLALPAKPTPTLMIAPFRRDAAASPAARIAMAAFPRNERSPLSCLKSLAYLESVLALHDARARGLDDALLPNTAGRVACASAANVFVVLKGRLVTPPPSEGCPPGIHAAARLGIEVEEAPLAPDALASADEAFLTNSLIGLRPVAAIEGRALPGGAPGPVTRALVRSVGQSHFPDTTYADPPLAGAGPPD